MEGHADCLLRLPGKSITKHLTKSAQTWPSLQSVPSPQWRARTAKFKLIVWCLTSLVIWRWSGTILFHYSRASQAPTLYFLFQKFTLHKKPLTCSLRTSCIGCASLAVLDVENALLVRKYSNHLSEATALEATTLAAFWISYDGSLGRKNHRNWPRGPLRNRACTLKAVVMRNSSIHTHPKTISFYSPKHGASSRHWCWIHCSYIPGAALPGNRVLPSGWVVMQRKRVCEFDGF